MLVPDHPAKAKPDLQAECSGVAGLCRDLGAQYQMPGARNPESGARSPVPRALSPEPRAQGKAPQISMRLARRRQSGASTGMALRLISFPSRRSTCSLEKFMTSTTVQKLLMENSLILLPWR